MIDVALLSVIRRWHLRDGVAIREISRRTGLSRNTIRKYLRSGGVEPRYPERQSPSLLDTFAPKLALWLQTDSKKNRKQRRNLRQMHADLVALGYTGSYDRVAAFARKWRQDQQEEARTCGRGTFIPLTFAPGDAFQFDWSEDWAVLGGVRTKLQVDQGVHHGAGRFAGLAAHDIPVDQDLAHHVLGEPRSAGTLDDNFRAKVVSTQG